MQRFQSMFQYFWAKLPVALPLSYFTISAEQTLIVTGLAFMVFIDTILGLWVSYKFRIFTSHRLGRIADKISKYFLALASIWILVCVNELLFSWAFQFVGIFLILTELFSNFEKLSLLGLEVPTKFLAKLNKNFHEYYFGDSESREGAIKRILDKQNCPPITRRGK